MKTNLKNNLKTAGKFILMFTAVAMLSTTFYSCEADDAGTSTSGCEDELLTLADILTTKSNQFSQNPTPSNCSALKQAALNLLNKAQQCGYEEEYAPLTAQWQQLDCSTFN